jgi:hypothetical protein
MVNAQYRGLQLAFAAFLCAMGSAVSGCAGRADSSPTITAASGAQVCARHKTTLRAVPGFSRPKPWPLIHGSELREYLDERYPNGIGPYYSLRKRDDFVPATVSYCPACEAAIQRGLKRAEGI